MRKEALQKLMLNKHKPSCVSDTDKHLGAANADTNDVKAKCGRQLYNTFAYKQLSKEVNNEVSKNLNSSLKSIVQNHFYKIPVIVHG